MLKREIVPLPRHFYPPDEWRLVEARWPGHLLERGETIFALANGYLGVRGTFEEGRPSLFPATFVNGFHETWPIVHAEEAYGLATTGQTIVNVPDATVLELFVDDEPLFLPAANLRQYERALDFRAGTLTRDLLWSTPSGKHVRVRTCRLVSFEHRHVLATSYEVTLLGAAAPLAVVSRVIDRQDQVRADRAGGAVRDPRLARRFEHRVLQASVARHHDGRLLFGYRTANSGMTLGLAVDHVIDVDRDHGVEADVDEDGGRVVVTADGEAGTVLRITKYAAYQTSRSVPATELVDRCRRTLDRVVPQGFAALLRHQRRHLDAFWERADVEVRAEPDPDRLQQAVRWNLFQLAQASWRAEDAGIPAKGLTGQAYEGHYFWDTEVYVLPFLAYTQPRIARNLLRFRYSMLDKARDQARRLGHRGALFPWRTINGDEASAYYQAGTAQYHIDADIAHAITRYVAIRGDVGFMVELGAEVLVETARMWEDLGFHGHDGRFHIHSVTGPDEYTTVVNDNVFTNLMARRNLRAAAETVRLLRAERPDDHAALVHAVGLDPAEVEAWERAADAMYVPYDDQRGIHPQDTSFLEREVWDLDATPPEKFPLLLHFHPLVIYRHQVIKQADVVLAMFLLGEEFTAEQKRRNFEYYDPLTTGDSSLSASVQSIVAAEVGDQRKALEYFFYALLIDLADVAGNVSDGVHIAACGGAWMALVQGFGGVRDHAGRLSFEPRLPRRWERLAFQVRFCDRQIHVELTHERERFRLVEGEPVDIVVRGRHHRLSDAVTLAAPGPCSEPG
jgi:alpha,alpha-trehalose phosphorylase